ncbi:MAG: ROK family protein, partial [Candidatus Rokuibacteriota bacterium]
VPGMPTAIGFDIGGSRIKLGVLTEAGRLRDGAARRIGPDTSVDVLAETLERETVRLLARHGRADCSGIGIGLPGIIEPGFGARHLPGKLPGLEGHPLRQNLEARLSLPVTCLNDGAAATMGEWRYGAGVGVQDLVMLTLGTGVGSGVVMNGRLLANRHLGTGGGVGHFTLEVGGRRCLCGNRGCPETRISAEAIAVAAADHLRRGVSSSLVDEFRRDPASVGFSALVAASRDGDTLSRELMAGFARDLGATIVSAIAAYNPDMVIIGGGMAAEGEAYMPDVQAYVDAHAWVYPPSRRVEVRTASFGEYSGVVGAAGNALVRGGVLTGVEAPLGDGMVKPAERAEVSPARREPDHRPAPPPSTRGE